MSGSARTIAIVGAGAFGVAAALELRRRGYHIILVDPGPLPHPEASSTDISKAVRMDYGTDALYTELAARSIPIWREWNERWGERLFHEDGFLLLLPRAMAPGGFEGDSFALLSARGLPLERIDPAVLRERFPAWASSGYADGYFNPVGGWAASGRAVALGVVRAKAAGVVLREGIRCQRLLERGSRVAGIVTADGEAIAADLVLVAAGAWTPALLPHLAGMMVATGHPVLHFAPADPRPFRGDRFPVWAADISGTGWYGFPANADGMVKVARHSVGAPMHPGDPKVVPPEAEATFRTFLRERLPALADAPLVHRRLCMYCDSRDGHFWIDHDPERTGLVVACGGSGHGFKFMPVLGEIIADVVLGQPNPAAQRFAWRAPARGWKQARHHDA